MTKFSFSWTKIVLILSLFLMIGCKKDNNLTEPSVNAPNRLPVHLGPSDYDSENTYYLLNDKEPESVYFNHAERTFYTDQPIQLSFDDDYNFQVRFYSPRALPNVTIWAKLSGYDEQFKLLELDKLMPFQQLRVKIPFESEDIVAQTRSGKTIKIMANPYFSPSDLSFEIECDAPYYKTLQSIKCHWRIRFSRYSTSHPYWRALHVHQAREGVAIALNLTYMYSSPEFATAMKEWPPLYRDNNKNVIDKDALLNKVIKHTGLTIGRVVSVNGLGGGTTFGLAEWCFLEHYADDKNEHHTIFHEFGHCLGYVHTGNMTYESVGGGGKGWQSLCGKVYRELCVAKKMPVYSRRFMHTRRNVKSSSGTYAASKYVIEDPELDEIDGGLAPSGQTDLNGENGNAVSFTLDYTAVPGATAATFSPKDVYVYNDSLFVVNNAAKNFSVEIFDIAGGKLTHLKSIKQWTLQDGKTTASFEEAPNGVTRANGRIYVTEHHSRTWVFDAEDQHFIACLGNGNWGTGGGQTVHAFDVKVYKGIIMIHDKRQVVFAEESMVDFLAPSLLVFTRSANVGEKDATYGMAVDTTNGILYSTHPNKRIDLFNLSQLRVSTTLQRAEFRDYKNVPYDLDFYNQKLYVSSNGTEKFCEVDPKSGAILKDHTTIGSITLQAPEKFCIRRQTLFIIDLIKGKPCVYAIPMSSVQ